MGEFGIKVEDGSSSLPEFVVDQNMKSMELYDWQRRAIKYFFENNCKAIFEVTTGAGKTYCGIEICKKVLIKDPDIRILIIVPKNVIMETGWYKELVDAGVGIQNVGVFYGNIKECCKFTITNMQSVHKLPLELFDMIIYDEIHNYGTARMLEFVKHDCKYKLGLSATLERMDKEHWKLQEIFDYNVFRYKPQEALLDGVLNPFNFINISIEMDPESFEEYLTLTQELNTILLAGGGYNKLMRSNTGLKYKMLSKMNERKSLINNYSRKFGIVNMIVSQHIKDKIIVFQEYNDSTNKMYWWLLEVGARACIFHSDVPKDKKEQNLIDFRCGKYNVILATRALDEGWNLPSLDVGIIAAGNSTSRQTVQRMGRVLRKKEKNSSLYQVYCKNTIEEEYSNERSKLFKELCSSYNEMHYTHNEEIKWREV